MRTKVNKVYLSDEERIALNKIVKSGTHSAQKIRRANILLHLDENHLPVKTQEEIAQICQTTPLTVYQLAKRFQDKGVEIVERKQRLMPPRKPIVTGEVEAHIIAINCSEPPAGKSRWTLSLTAEKLVEMNIVSSISRDTVARALKKRIKASLK